MADELLTTDDVALLIAVAPKTLRNWRHMGGGPPAVKLTPARGGAVRYRRSAVERWLAARVETRTHERAS
jgi:predicted DNA-binding transcriptional regulator AlpA